MIYSIVKSDTKTGMYTPTGLSYALKRDTLGNIIETGDDALAFAKQLEVFFDDGYVYEVNLVG